MRRACKQRNYQHQSHGVPLAGVALGLERLARTRDSMPPLTLLDRGAAAGTRLGQRTAMAGPQMAWV